MTDFPLHPFLAALEADGLRVTLRDYDRLQLALQSGGLWTLPRLRDVLLALLVKDSDQQDRFLRRFNEFFTPALVEPAGLADIDIQQLLVDLRRLTAAQPGVPPAPPVDPNWPGATHARRHSTPASTFRYWRLLASLLALLLVILLFGLNPVDKAVPPSTQTPAPTHAPVPTPKVVEPLAAPATSTQQRRYTDIPYIAEPLVYERLTVMDEWMWYALIAALLLLTTASYGYWLWRSRRIPEDKAPPYDPNKERYFPLGAIGGKPAPLLDAQTLSELADAVGYFHSEEGGRTLNVPASIQLTLVRGGIPALKFYQRQQLRTLLILEDAFAEPLAWNPIAQELATGMQALGVPVVFGRFYGSLQHFKTADGLVQRLEDFADHRHGHLLLIFSDGKGLLRHDSLFALEEVARWPLVAWLELREPRFWDGSTALPKRYGLPLYPATPDGIRQALQRFLSEQRANTLSFTNGSAPSLAPRLADSNLDAYVEDLLGDALRWAQDCAMLQPVSLGLADALRRRFHPHLPAGRLQRLSALPGTTSTVAGLHFSADVARVLRTAFLVRRPAREQVAVLRFLVAEIEQVRPADEESLAYLAWQAVKERVRLELDQDDALKKLAGLAKTPLGRAIDASLDKFGFLDDPAKIPLRLRPNNQHAWQRLARISDSFNIDKVEAYPIQRAHWLALSLLGFFFFIFTGLGIIRALQPTLPEKNWQIGNSTEGLENILARLVIVPKDDQPRARTGRIEQLTDEVLDPTNQYRITLYTAAHPVTAQELVGQWGQQAIITLKRHDIIDECHLLIAEESLLVQRCPESDDAQQPMVLALWRDRFRSRRAANRLASIGLEIASGRENGNDLRRLRDVLLQTSSVDVIYRVQTDNRGDCDADLVLQQLQTDLGPLLPHSQFIGWTKGPHDYCQQKLMKVPGTLAPPYWLANLSDHEWKSELAEMLRARTNIIIAENILPALADYSPGPIAYPAPTSQAISTSLPALLPTVSTFMTATEAIAPAGPQPPGLETPTANVLPIPTPAPFVIEVSDDQIVSLLAQYRCPANLIAPRSDPEGVADFVMLMDVSASFKSTDPNNARISAANLFIDLLLPQERAAVIQFGNKALRISGHTNNKNQLKEAIAVTSNEYIPVGTQTDTSHGLAAALCELLAQPQTGRTNRSSVILLTDGLPDPSSQTDRPTPPTILNQVDSRRFNTVVEYRYVEGIAQRFAQNGWPISSIHFCNPIGASSAIYQGCENNILQSIAGQTGGIYVPVREIERLAEAYLTILDDVYQYRTLIPDLASNLAFIVPPGTQELLIVSKNAIDPQPIAEGISPGVRQCSQTNEPNVENYHICRIGSPGVGSWSIDSQGTDIQIILKLVEVDFGVALTLVESQDIYVAGNNPIQFEARLLDENGEVVRNRERLDFLDAEIGVLVTDSLGNTTRVADLARATAAPESDAAFFTYTGAFTCASPGKYTLSPVLGDFIRRNTEVTVECLSSPTPIVTSTHTVTPTQFFLDSAPVGTPLYELQQSGQIALEVRGKWRDRFAPEQPILVVRTTLKGSEQVTGTITVGQILVSRDPAYCNVVALALIDHVELNPSHPSDERDIVGFCLESTQEKQYPTDSIAYDFTPELVAGDTRTVMLNLYQKYTSANEAYRELGANPAGQLAIWAAQSGSKDMESLQTYTGWNNLARYWAEIVSYLGDESIPIPTKTPMPSPTPTFTPTPTPIPLSVVLERDLLLDPPKITLGSTGVVGSRVMIKIDGRPETIIPVSPDGTWSAIIFPDVGPGEHHIQIELLDEDGTVIGQSELIPFVMPTITSTPTVTDIPIRIPTETPTPIPPNTVAATSIQTTTATFTGLPPATRTQTLTATPTFTLTITPILTATLVATPTPTNTPKPEPPFGATAINPIDAATYIYVPSGEFFMNLTLSDVMTNTTQGFQPVVVAGFWIMKTEVTNAQYKQCVDSTSSQRCTEPNNTIWNQPAYAHHPVTDVTVEQASRYAQWAGGRLPTEAEWEKAARGKDDNRTYPWGDNWNGQSLNFCDEKCENQSIRDAKVNDGYKTTAPVGCYPDGASPYGVLDMVGNVWEWTGAEEEVVYVVRGGSWNNPQATVQIATRNVRNENLANSVTGFRVVRSLFEFPYDEADLAQPNSSFCQQD